MTFEDGFDPVSEFEKLKENERKGIKPEPSLAWRILTDIVLPILKKRSSGQSGWNIVPISAVSGAKPYACTCSLSIPGDPDPTDIVFHAAMNGDDSCTVNVLLKKKMRRSTEDGLGQRTFDDDIDEAKETAERWVESKIDDAMRRLGKGA